MTKTLRILESQYKKLIREFDKNDNENSKEEQTTKVEWLLNSGDEQNIELAFMLMDSLNLDKKALLQPYQETFEFLRNGFMLRSAQHYDEMTLESFYEVLTKKTLAYHHYRLQILPELRMPNLESLNLISSKILNNVLPQFRFTPNLQLLELSNNQLLTIPTWNIPSLKVLNLSGNKLTNISVFKNLNKLDKLIVTGNPFTETQQTELQQMLPNTSIEF